MTDLPPDLRQGLADLTLTDERRLRRRLESLERAAPDRRRPAERRLLADYEAARRRVEVRRGRLPRVRYPSDLPVAEARDEIAAALRDSQVVVVAGDTGSGKTTQLPKICLELGRGVRGMIGHTQPRRLAARTVAERVAEELDVSLGDAVGYTVRFTDRVSELTLVKVMTDGILLAEVHRDRLLERYDTLIIDEAHERSLNIDFLLGYVKRLLPRRPDLKVVITSATIDTARFARHFDDAPIVAVSGRTYPVEVRYRPVEEADDTPDQTQAVCDAVGELSAEGPGDILVFLSGEREIRDTADALRELDLADTELLPLYARLSTAEQHRVFRPHSGRRVVLATNVAETSLTVPGIRYVVDAGTARISRYSRRTKVQRLPIEPVSRASADQRAGRCGRLGPGICVRLYSEEDYRGRPEFTEPEILRTNLASVILQMAAIGLGDMATFPFVDPPDARAVRDGVALLEELGAFAPGDGAAGDHRLTPLGRELAQLPVDPRLGRMILEAGRQGCLREVLVVASGLSIQDPRERPTGKEQAAAELHSRFADPASDLVAYLRLWEYLQDRQAELSSSQFRRLCRSEHLNYLRVREWQDVHGQLRLVARGLGLAPNRQPAPVDRVHRSVLAGLLSHIGLWDPARREYRGARNARFSVAPGSALFKRTARWVMAAELVETNRMWARDVARIHPEWAERLAGHLVKRTYAGPWWDPARGGAVGEERVTLYGLPLVAGRKVGYGRVDPDEARRMFLRLGLVEGDWDAEPDFARENRKLIDDLRAVEGRARRRDVVIDDEGVADLYDAVVPREVTSGGELERWWRRARAADPDLLTFTPGMLVRPGAPAIDLDAYPEQWRQGDLVLPLSYRFDPGSDDDGVTVEVPLASLNQLNGEGFDWQVPGLREELVTAWIRALPKALRRHLVPAAGHAREFLARAGPGDGALLEVLAGELRRTAGIDIPRDAWDLHRVPGHLRMKFSVVGGRGDVIAAGTDLDDIKARLRAPLQSALAGATGLRPRSGCTDWDFGRIEPVVEGGAGGAARGYPALVDEGDSVGLRVMPTPEEQSAAMWAGVRRLLLIACPGAADGVQRGLDNRTRLSLAAAPGATVADLLDDCLACAADRIMAREGGVVWDPEGFAGLRDEVRRHLVRDAAEVAREAGSILASAGQLADRLAQLRSPSLRPAVEDLGRQLSALVAPGFVAGAGWERLPELRRYLAAAERRLDKLAEAPARDRQRMDAVNRLEDDLARVRASLPLSRRHEADRVRWMIEELRVSLWAQVLGTPYPVSEARVGRELEQLAKPG